MEEHVVATITHSLTHTTHTHTYTHTPTSPHPHPHTHTHISLAMIQMPNLEMLSAMDSTSHSQHYPMKEAR